MVFSVVVLRGPGMSGCGARKRDRPVEYVAVLSHSFFDCRCIDEGLESRAGLPHRHRDPVELGLPEIVASDQSLYVAVSYIDGDQGCLHAWFGALSECRNAV